MPVDEKIKNLYSVLHSESPTSDRDKITLDVNISRAYVSRNTKRRKALLINYRVSDSDLRLLTTKSHSLPGHALPVHKSPAPPKLFSFFPSSSYLPCWRDRDQKGGSLLLELCIAHRGSPGGQVIFGYLAGIIFDGSPSLSRFSFYQYFPWLYAVG